MTRHLQKLIHVGCRELGIDGETRRDLQLQLVGKESMADMTEFELTAMLDGLKARGFKPKGRAKPAAKRADLRYVHVLWGLLGKAGKLKQQGRAGLNGFVRHAFEKHWGSVPLDIDMLTDHDQISDVIRALEAWCRRAGVSLQK